MTKILVLDDEQDIRDFIILNLKRAGYETIGAQTGEQALELVFDKSNNISIAILDIMLPGIDGNTVCQKIREFNKEIGIIMLSAKDQEADKIEGLTNGADDYVAKPFSPQELIARVSSLNRRIQKNSNFPTSITLGVFELNTEKRILYKNSKHIDLTQVEFELIKVFFENPGKAFSREDLLNLVWGTEFFGYAKTIDVNIRRIRQKIEDEPSKPKYIETIWGYGYKWNNE